MQKLELMEFRLTAWSIARGCSKSVVLKIIKSNKNGISFFFFFIAKFWQCFVMKEVMNLEEGKGGVVWFLKPADATSLQTHNRHHPLLSSSTFIVVRAFIHVQASASKMAYHKHKKTLSEKIKTKMGFSLSPFPCHLLLGKWIEEIAEIRSLNTISALFLACLLAGVMKLTQISNKFQIDES